MHWNLVKLRVIVHGILDRGLHNLLVGTILEQKEVEARRSGTVLKCLSRKQMSETGARDRSLECSRHLVTEY